MLDSDGKREHRPCNPFLRIEKMPRVHAPTFCERQKPGKSPVKSLCRMDHFAVIAIMKSIAGNSSRNDLAFI
jgi:hypothetical protein